MNALDGFYVGNGTTITGYNVGIKISNQIGGAGGPHATNLSNPINGVISGCDIYNNNSENTHPTLHPSILFASENNMIWQDFYNLVIANCNIYDSRLPKQQTNAVSFDGQFKDPIKGIQFVCTQLSGDGGASIAVASGVDISNIEVIYPNPLDWVFSGPFPGKLVKF